MIQILGGTKDGTGFEFGGPMAKKKKKLGDQLAKNTLNYFFLFDFFYFFWP
jgi:hypothetical protein